VGFVEIVPGWLAYAAGFGVVAGRTKCDRNNMGWDKVKKKGTL